jgi:hypothetical protein
MADRENVKLAKELLELKAKIKKEEKIIADMGEKVNQKNVQRLETLKRKQAELNKIKSTGDKEALESAMEQMTLDQLKLDLSKKFFKMEKKGNETILSRTKEYFKQGNALHGFLETTHNFGKQYILLNERIKGANSLLSDDMPQALQNAGLDLQDMVSHQSDNLDLSQQLANQYDDMGKDSFSDLTKQAEKQEELVRRQGDYVKQRLLPDLQKQLELAKKYGKDTTGITTAIQQITKSQRESNAVAKQNVKIANEQRINNAQTAAAAELILDPMNKAKSLLESTKAGKLASELVGVGDATEHFSDTMKSYITNSLDKKNPMNFGLAMTKMFNQTDKNGRVTRGQFQIMFDKMGEGFESMKKIFGGINGAMGGMLGPALAVVAILMIAKKAAEMFYGGMLETRKEFGITATEAAGLQNTLNTTAMEMKFLGVSAEDVKAGAQGIMDNMGGIGQLTNENVKSMARLNGLYGISGENLGILRAQMGAVGVSSQEAFDSQLGSVAALSQAGGVAPAAIMNDVASNSEAFAKFAGEGGDNVFKAAVAARQLGLDMASVEKIADSLLDFESSINSQMEASMLLGRSINTDKAREMALNGNLEGMQKEITKQIGTAADFERLNVVQRKSLADAFGVSVSELGKMVTNQDKLNSMTEGERKRRDLITGAMEQMGKVFTSFMGIFKAAIPLALAFLSPFIILGGTIIGILALFSEFIQFLNKANVLGVGLGDVIMFAAGAALLFRTNLMGGGIMGFLKSTKDMIFSMGGKLKGMGGMLGGGGQTATGGKPGTKVTANKKPAIPQRGKGGGGPLGGMFEKFDAKKALGGAAALLIISAALFVTAKALQEFSKVSWSDMGKAGVALLALTLTLAAIGAIMMSGVGALAIIAGAGAMLVMAAALLVLGVAIQAIGKGFDMLAQGFSSFVPIIQTLAPMASSIFLLAGAFTALGVSMGAMALGALALIPALPVLLALGAVGALGGLVTGGESSTAETTENPVELKLDSTNKKLDELIVLLGDGGTLAENLHGIKRNTGDFTDSILTA